jgi:sarcosine oxidase subunit alpha
MFEARLKPPAAAVSFTIDGKPHEAPDGVTVAEALLLAGCGQTRLSPVGGQPRAPYCMMGVCFECLVTIDGVAGRQGCMVRLRDGMSVVRQTGKVKLAP